MGRILNKIYGFAIGMPILALVISGFNSHISRSALAEVGLPRAQQAAATAIPTLTWDQWYADYCGKNPGAEGCETAGALEATSAPGPTSESQGILYNAQGLQVDAKRYYTRSELEEVLADTGVPAEHIGTWADIIFCESKKGIKVGEDIILMADSQENTGDGGHAWGFGQINDTVWKNGNSWAKAYPELWPYRLTAKGNLELIERISGRGAEAWHGVYNWSCAEVLGLGDYLP